MSERVGRRDSGASIIRTVIVVLLGVWVVAGSLPGLDVLVNPQDHAWGPNGSYGFTPDYDGRLGSVVPGSPAAKAGLQAGDHIDLARTSAYNRNLIAAAPPKIHAGQVLDVFVSTQSGDRELSLVAPQAPLPLIGLVERIAQAVAGLVAVVIGGLLVLLRPSIMTWGFYFYCLGFSPGVVNLSFARFPSLWPRVSCLVASDFLAAAATVGLLLFALNFLRDDPSSWRRAIERAVPYLFVLFAILIAYPDVANIVLGQPAETAQRFMLALQGIILGASILITIDSYMHGRLENRPRIKFVVFGLIVGVLGTYVGSVLLYSSILPFNPPRWFSLLLLLLSTMLPIAVAYAVVRHRVLDISFVVNRALIYSIMTFLLVGGFALLGWFLGTELQAVGLARVIEIAVAITLSFWLNDLQNKVGAFVDAIFFRQRRTATRRLSLAAASMTHAQSETTIDGLVANEAAAALDLASAALFRRGSDGAYHIVRAMGWESAAKLTITHEDRLALALEAQQQPLRLSELGWANDSCPSGSAAPVLAIPMAVRRHLEGFALYGAHSNGADIDPDEVRSLAMLGDSASNAYERLRSEALDREVAMLKAKLAEKSDLPLGSAVRIQPAT